jgi:hypothetical protein
MVEVVQVAACSQINTKHIRVHKLWAEPTVVEF